ncbi:MAG: hypothetical protein AAFR12_04540 [Cyanobacteria bacterium J06626_6]
MKRFTLSALSVVLTLGAIAPTAQALPQGDPDFKLQTLRLEELDARNKSAAKSTFKLQTLRLEELDARNKSENSDYPYGQTPAQTSAPTSWTESAPTTSAEQVAPADADATVVIEEAQGEDADSQAISLIERRHQVLDRD